MSIIILIIIAQPLATGRSPAYPNQRLDLELNQFDWIFDDFQTTMAQVILDNLDPPLLEKLKIRAAHHQRPLEEELKAILQDALEAEQAAKMKTFCEQTASMRQALAGRVHTDSTELVRQDRER